MSGDGGRVYQQLSAAQLQPAMGGGRLAPRSAFQRRFAARVAARVSRRGIFAARGGSGVPSLEGGGACRPPLAKSRPLRSAPLAPSGTTGQRPPDGLVHRPSRSRVGLVVFSVFLLSKLQRGLPVKSGLCVCVSCDLGSDRSVWRHSVLCFLLRGSAISRKAFEPESPRLASIFQAAAEF